MPTGRKARLVLNCADLNLAKFSLYIVLKFHCTLESVRLNIFENLPCEVPEKIRYSSTDRTVCLIQVKSDSTAVRPYGAANTAFEHGAWH